MAVATLGSGPTPEPVMTDLPVAEVLQRADANLDASVARLFDLLRIPSVSTDPAFAEDVGRAAPWMADELAGLGFDASVRPSAGPPLVVAHHPGPAGAAPHIPHHSPYDVQPAAPPGPWTRRKRIV